MLASGAGGKIADERLSDTLSVDAIQHLAGCDLRHRRRQRCSTWTPDIASTPTAAGVRGAGDPLLHEVAFDPLLAVVAAFVAGMAAVVIALAIGLFALLLVLGSALGWITGAPGLPAFAMPHESALLAIQTGACRNDIPSPEYRSALFGTSDSFETVKQKLKTSFERQGVIVDESRGDRLALYVGGVFVSYTDHVSSWRNWEDVDTHGYPVVFEVYIAETGCLP